MARETVIRDSRPNAPASPPSSATPPAAPAAPADPPLDEALRPRRLDDVVGQQAVVERLRVTVDACRKTGEGLPHLLLDGPPGVGKTTLANVLPRELGVDLFVTSGPALKAPKELMPYLTQLTEKSVLFIDEIHRLPRIVEEFIYPAMEDYRIDIVLGEGLGARTISMPLKKFTLIGATTRSGMLSAPFRDRFKLQEHLEFYSQRDLETIVAANARKLALALAPGVAAELAKRSRGTPRIANSHLYWARQYAISRADGVVSADVARRALEMREVDHEGLDKQDRAYLETLIRVFGGGPAGVEALAATMNLAVDTLSEEVEPFMLRSELIVRTPRGRRATARAYAHLGLAAPTAAGAGFLFE